MEYTLLGKDRIKHFNHSKLLQAYVQTDLKTTANFHPNLNTTNLPLDETVRHPDLIPIDHIYYTAEDFAKSSSAPLTSTSTSPSPPQQPEEQADPKEIPKIHPSLNHLYAVLADHLTDKKSLAEITSLLNTLKPNTKTPFVDIHQLIPSFEKVLTQLKNYKEHSLPFLQRVSKKDAPDYYKIIKNPMDLGTMSKKLKNNAYNTKKEFASDLALIWQNCLDFNVVPPDNIYITHANAMKKRSLELLRIVPEVKNMVEDDPDSDSDDESPSPPVQLPNKGNSTKTTPQRTSNSSLASSTEDLTNKLQTLSSSNSLENILFNDVCTSEEASTVVKQEKEAEKEDEMVDASFDVQYCKWRDVTMDFRRKLIQYKTDQFNLPFPDRFALLFRPIDAKTYYDAQKEFHARNLRRLVVDYTDPAQVKAIQIPEMSEEEGLSIYEFFFPELMPIAFPELPGMKIGMNGNVVGGVELFDDYLPMKFIESLPSLSDVYSISYATPEQGNSKKMQMTILQNCTQLRMIKEVHAKIIAKEQKIPESHLGIPPPPTPYIPKKPVHQVVMNTDSAACVLKQVIALLLNHIGFDSTTEIALTTLLQTTINFLTNLGKTIHTYDLQNPPSQLKRKTIQSGITKPHLLLSRTLSANGVTEQALLRYIQYDVQKYSRKLWELRRKLESAYEGLCKDVDEEQRKGDDGEDIVMEEVGDQLITGSLFEDVGIDLLGLKGIGIESFNSIPTELWNKKAEKPIRARVARRVIEKEEAVEIPESTRMIPLPPWTPITADTQIGLLKNYYKKKQEANDMIEDEQKTKKTKSKQSTILKVALIGRKKFGISQDAIIPMDKSKKKSTRGIASSPDVHQKDKDRLLKKQADKAMKQKSKEDKKLLKAKKRGGGG